MQTLLFDFSDPRDNLDFIDNPAGCSELADSVHCLTSLFIDEPH